MGQSHPAKPGQTLPAKRLVRGHSFIPCQVDHPGPWLGPLVPPCPAGIPRQLPSTPLHPPAVLVLPSLWVLSQTSGPSHWSCPQLLAPACTCPASPLPTRMQRGHRKALFKHEAPLLLAGRPRDLSAKISRQRRGFSRSRRNLVGSLQPPPAASSVSCDGRLTAFVNILTTGEGFFGRNSSSSLPEAKRQAGKELQRTQRDQVPITPPRDGPQPRHCLGVWALCTGHLWCLWRPQSRQLGCKEQGHTQSEMLWHPYGRPMLQAATWRAVS